MDTQKHPYISINGDIADKVINTKKNIGIMISGDKSSSNYKQITVPQDQLQSVFKNSGHNLIDLNAIDDFYALSEVVKDLDLVISIESDLVHLAGSLNIPTWVMLPAVPKHTWDLNYKETTPWYSSVELFRQESRGNWSGVINRIEERLLNV